MSRSPGAKEKGDLSELKEKGNLSEEEVTSILKQMLAKETKKEKSILKKGNWSISEENEIMESIQKACTKFPADLDKQVSLMHFSLELSFGKRIQIFIYNKKCT